MKIYFAGAEASYRSELFNLGAKNFLLSYFTFRNGNAFNGIRESLKDSDIFMDCGAYSAWSQGKPIDVHGYAQFIKENQEYITTYPNLDVKGDIDATLENQRILEEEYGLNPIPVYHLNTDKWEVFEKYIQNYSYIALGAIAGETGRRDSLYKRLDTVFAMIDKSPVTKLHGFGMTIMDVLKRYPFYSVDSTTWLSGVRYGNVVDNKLSIMYARKRNAKKLVRQFIKQQLKDEGYLTNLWKLRGIEFN